MLSRAYAKVYVLIKVLDLHWLNHGEFIRISKDTKKKFFSVFGISKDTKKCFLVSLVFPSADFSPPL